MPPYVSPGWSWNSADGTPPAQVISFDDSNDDFILAALWDAEEGTEIAVFPLGRGDERLETLPIVADLRKRDPSLAPIGVIPDRTVMLSPPEVTEEMITEGVQLAGLPLSEKNVGDFGRVLAQHLTLKALQLMSSRDSRAADRFAAAHRWNGGSLTTHCQSILDDLVAWDTSVLPYIQEVPMRMRALVLDALAKDPSAWARLTT